MSRFVTRIERLVLLAVGGFACSYATAPPDVERYEPPSVYAVWYAEVQDCAALEGLTLEELEFWRVPGASRITVSDTSYTAYFEAPNTIVVAGFYTTSKPAITHELLHAILVNDPYHKSSLWKICVDSSASL